MYVFYDFETTGINPAFDQPTQFAAILTDEKFNEIEAVNWRCQLSHHILPSPKALNVTKTTVDQLIDKSLPTLFEMARKIQNLIVKWTPAIWIGYNSINFDELILRQIFYQNLQPNVYATQINGNSRSDLLTLMYAVHGFYPLEFSWPRNDSGSHTFKLDRLAPENGYLKHDAHDALGDVRATIFLAKRLKYKCPPIWKHAIRCSSKHNLNSLLMSGDPLLLVIRTGSGSPTVRNIAFVGRSTDDQNKVAVLDLDILMELNVKLDNIGDSNIFDLLKKDRRLIKIIRLNSAPFIIKNDDPSKVIMDNTEKIIKNVYLHQKVSNLFLDVERNNEKSKFIELQIYDRFIIDKDKAILNEISSCSWEERKSHFKNLNDRRLKLLGKRLLFLEAPKLLSENARKKSFDAIIHRWNQDEKEAAMWTTFSKVQEELNELEAHKLLTKTEKKRFESFYAERPENLRIHLLID